MINITDNKEPQKNPIKDAAIKPPPLKPNKAEMVYPIVYHSRPCVDLVI